MPVCVANRVEKNKIKGENNKRENIFSADPLQKFSMWALFFFFFFLLSASSDSDLFPLTPLNEREKLNYKLKRGKVILNVRS